MLKKYITFLLFFMLLLASSGAFAQGPPGDCPGCPPTNTPIDGGLGILLAIGVGYAVSKLRKED